MAEPGKFNYLIQTPSLLTPIVVDEIFGIKIYACGAVPKNEFWLGGQRFVITEQKEDGRRTCNTDR